MKKMKQEPRGKVAVAPPAVKQRGASGTKQKRSIMTDGVEDVELAQASVNGTASTRSVPGPRRQAAGAATLLEEGQESPERARRWTFSRPTRAQLVGWAPFLGILLLGAILRFWGLGDKPLHHDESLHAYFSLQLMHNLENWRACFNPATPCYHYDPLLHGPFQFHAIALIYQISQWLNAPDHGVNTTTVRIAAATLGSFIVFLPFFLRDYLGKPGAWLACFLLAISPSMVYFSRFAREDIYMAFFTLLLVVATARYVRSHKGTWLVVAAAAFAFSYATKEATFLSIAVFGSFLGALLVWELGAQWPLRISLRSDSAIARYLPRTAAPLALALYFLLLAPIAKFFFAWMKTLSIYVSDPKNAGVSNAYVQHLKDQTLSVLPWLGAILALVVISFVVRGWFGRASEPRRGFLARHINAEKQPLLDAIMTMPWYHWFLALCAGVTVFVVLFTVLFTNFKGGIGDGIWQGLYYWLQQQQVARGSQPWYYYFVLIPLYEQIGLVFGLVGVVHCLRHPSRLRLFLIYWFVGNVFIYSWAGEKMPWLTIHMAMPMLLLAAIGLQPLAVHVLSIVRGWYTRYSVTRSAAGKRKKAKLVVPAQARMSPPERGRVIVGVLVTAFLLLLTLQNMFQLSFVHAADGPHEMMIYVQTTVDVNTVMDRIDALDQQFHNSQHQLSIGVTADAQWPFYWYLRDYTNVCYTFPNCPDPKPEVIVSAGDSLASSRTGYATATNGRQADYLFHQYRLRAWWDEGYKPPPCVLSKTVSCQGQPTWGGVGLFKWLSYGDTPPARASFDPGLAVSNLWQWWWQRKPFGSTLGSTDMGFLIRRDLGMNP